MIASSKHQHHFVTDTDEGFCAEHNTIPCSNSHVISLPLPIPVPASTEDEFFTPPSSLTLNSNFQSFVSSFPGSHNGETIYSSTDDANTAPATPPATPPAPENPHAEGVDEIYEIFPTIAPGCRDGTALPYYTISTPNIQEFLKSNQILYHTLPSGIMNIDDFELRTRCKDVTTHTTLEHHFIPYDGEYVKGQRKMSSWKLEKHEDGVYLYWTATPKHSGETLQIQPYFSRTKEGNLFKNDRGSKYRTKITNCRIIKCGHPNGDIYQFTTTDLKTEFSTSVASITFNNTRFVINTYSKNCEMSDPEGWLKTYKEKNISFSKILQWFQTRK
jgi:hypothetical protein